MLNFILGSLVMIIYFNIVNMIKNGIIHKHKWIKKYKTYNIYYNIMNGYFKEIYQNYKCEICGKEKHDIIDTVYPKIPFDI